MTKYYKIVKDDSMINPYAVFVKCTGFWQQISPWYFRRGNAERYLWKIIKNSPKNEWNENSPKSVSRFTQINGRSRLTSAEIEVD